MAVNLINSNDIEVEQTGQDIQLKTSTPISTLEGGISDNTTNIQNIKDGNVYSTNEVKTNKVWINGKPIYRKLIDLGPIGSDNVYITKTINDGYYDTITDFKGYKYVLNVRMSLYTNSPDGWMNVSYNKNAANNLLISIYRSSAAAWADWSIKLIIEYTKVS